jgi:uncharacterized protein YggE
METRKGDPIKTISRYLTLAVILAAALLAGFPSIQPVFAQTPVPTTGPEPVKSACDTTRTINVTGSAAVNVAPDRAQIQLGVQSNSTTVDGVQYDNDRAIQNVLAAVKNQGVNPADISTDIYVIEPVYEDYDSLFIKGYRIHNSVSITVRDVTKTSAILAAALKAGANQVSDVSFYTSDLRKYRDQARDLAITAAREKADALAGAAGAKTGCVMNINENSWTYFNNPWSSAYRNSSQMTQNVIQNNLPAGGTSAGSGGDEPISPGKIAVKAEVTVTYALQ